MKNNNNLKKFHNAFCPLASELRPDFKRWKGSLKNMDKVTAREPVAQTLEKYQHIFNPWPAFLQQLKDT